MALQPDYRFPTLPQRLPPLSTKNEASLSKPVKLFKNEDALGKRQSALRNEDWVVFVW